MRVPCLLLAVCVLLAGCGGSAARPPTGPHAGPPALVVLRFWHAVSTHRYRAAYRDLSVGVRHGLPYRRFAADAAGARTVFARRPRVVRVHGRGKVRAVYVASARGELLRADSVKVVFTVRRYGRVWLIAAPGLGHRAASR